MRKHIIKVDYDDEFYELDNESIDLKINNS